MAAKDKNGIIQDITNRYRVTAREARDIVTAVTTAAKAVAVPGKNYGNLNKPKGKTVAKAAVDVAKQVGETARAAATGKKGTTAMKIKTMVSGKGGFPVDVEPKSGKKRK